MVALAITAAQVLPDTAYPTRTGTSAVAIAAGQAVYLDPATNTVKLWTATGAIATSIAPGIAINSAPGAGQPIVWQEAAGAEVTVGAAAAPVAGTAYVGGATAGAVHPQVDAIATWNVALIGFGKTGNKIKLTPFNSTVTL